MVIRGFLILIQFISLFGSEASLAAPADLTYQGRILKSDGDPLEHSSVGVIAQRVQ